jgi:hypothetical protein
MELLSTSLGVPDVLSEGPIWKMLTELFGRMDIEMLPTVLWIRCAR